MFVYCTGADLHLLYIRLLIITQNDDTIRQLLSNKTLVKSICLGVHHQQLNKAQTIAGVSIIMLIMQTLCDIINLSTPFLKIY